MSIGAGIAILGVWLFAGICSCSKNVSGLGMVVSIFIAVIITCFIIISRTI